MSRGDTPSLSFRSILAPLRDKNATAVLSCAIMASCNAMPPNRDVWFTRAPRSSNTRA
ncbi:hypothetical protein LPJ58_007153, partial [Coemansia sp. RSA 1591]